jgi:molecular chaperone Hsp33
VASDTRQKFIFEHYPIKGSVVHMNSSWLDVRARAKPPSNMKHMLAETLCASVLLTSNIKFRGAVSLQIQSSGAVRLLLGQCTDKLEVRGVVRTSSELSTPLLRETVLSINLEPADGGAPYQGIVQFQENSLARSLEGYFKLSEQLDTRFWLASNEQFCGGLMLQRMPGQLADRDAWNKFISLASTVSDEELLGLSASELIHRLFHEEDIRLFKPAPVRFACKCSQEGVADMLKCLGESEARDIIEEQGSVEVRCEYCGHSYSFDSVDVAVLFAGHPHSVADTPGLQ